MLNSVELQPLKTFRTSTNRASLLVIDGQKWLVKQYAGSRQKERRDWEEHTLRVWSEAGFPVPRTSSLTLPELSDTPYLIMEFIDGPTLQEYLKREDVGRDEKVAILSRIYRENCRRQAKAMSEQEPALFHPDANTSNVILADNGFRFIDFETAIDLSRINEMAAIETAKFSRWSARDIGRDALPELMTHLVDAYQDQLSVLRQIIRRTNGRTFQFFHRWQDRKRKRKHPAEVTKYDIADTLAEAMEKKRSDISSENPAC